MKPTRSVFRSTSASLIRGLSMALALTVLSAEHASAKGVHYVVYLLAGQSNMDGRAAVADLKGPLAPYAKPRPEILIGYSAGGLHRPLRESSGFEPLHPGCSGTPAKAGGPPPTNTFGPELSFGPAIAAALPGQKILLLKVSEGGTSLAVDWNPNDPQKLYARFIHFVEAAQAKLKSDGDEVEIRGLIWMQGESDETLPPGKYQALLTAFIAKVRTDLKMGALPFVIGQVYDNGKRTAVIADQKAVATTVPATAFVDGTGLNTFDHGTHYDAASQIELGRRFAREVLKLSMSPRK